MNRHEKIVEIKRSELWERIYSIVSQIPRKRVSGDAMDAPSAATQIEKIIEQLEPEGEVSKVEMEMERIKVLRNDTWVDTASFKFGFKKCWEWMRKLTPQQPSEGEVYVECDYDDATYVAKKRQGGYLVHDIRLRKMTLRPPQQPSEGEIDHKYLQNLYTKYSYTHGYSKGLMGLLNFKAAIKELLNR